MTGHPKQRVDKFHPHLPNFASSRGKRPNLPARRSPRVGAADAQVQCPNCGAWRPPFCISETTDGWMGDCCISKKQRAEQRQLELRGEE
jgi:hypothetical protein